MKLLISLFLSIGLFTCAVKLNAQGNIVNSSIYINSEKCSDLNNGKSWSSALCSMKVAFTKISRGNTIYLYGKIAEDSLITPKGITDITVIGHASVVRMGNHSNNNGPKGGSSYWTLQSDTTTSPLLTITQQGWSFSNIALRGSANSPIVSMIRNNDGESKSGGFAGDHASFTNVEFVGPSKFSIYQEGGINGVKITNSSFFNSSTAIGGMNVSVGFALFWDIRNNTFTSNNIDIQLPLTNSIISDNNFLSHNIFKTESQFNDLDIDLTNGNFNLVFNNQLGRYYDGSSSHFKSGQEDIWGPNNFRNSTNFGIGK